MAQEFRINLRTGIPFDLSAHAASVGMIDILQKAKAEILKKHGIDMTLDHAVVTPRAPKKTPGLGLVSVEPSLRTADNRPPAEPVAEAPLVFAPGREPATAKESAESLLTPPTDWKAKAAEAKAKREAEKTGEAA